MAQQKSSGTKPNTGGKPEPTPPPRSQVDRYTVKPEFWDSILDSLPPWGDEIAAIVLIVFGIVSFLSLLNVSADATISTAWSNTLKSLFGYGSVIVSAGILGLGIVILLPKMGRVVKFPTRRILALEVAFLSLLALLHLAANDPEMRAIARAGEGGGYIGYTLSIIIAGLFGSIPAILFYGGLFILSIGVVFGLRQSHITTWLENTSQRLRSYGEKALEKTRPKPKPQSKPAMPNVEQALSGQTAPPKRTSGSILRIRPNLDNVPPSLRPGAQTHATDEKEALSEPTLLTLDKLKGNFNAIGTLKGKKVKGTVVQVERPDGRIKRYYTVSDMKEQKRIGKRDPNLPPLELLRDIELHVPDEQEINNNVVLIENTLLEFEIDVDVVDVKVGPTVTQYAVQPFKETNTDEGETVVQRTRINKIASLAGDLTLALSAKRLRLESPVPGHTYVGIEVPNRNPSVVALRSVYESKTMQDQLAKAKSPLFVPLGRDVSGAPLGVDLAQMPHLLIAGTTGSGKSVCIAALASALVLNNMPDQVKLVMLDPKMVELNRFNGLPHLLGPVETDQERIIEVLRWCTREMDRRYKLLEEYAVRNIDSFNARLGRRQKDEYMPYIVILIDEIGDLMLSRPDETEKLVTRLAQKARAAGMHLVIATQRPSVDVITGLIKANFPSRISFAVASGIDSRVILDSVGAENLLGRGDMLYFASDAAGPRRVQGCYVSDDEVRSIVAHWKTWYKEQIEKGKMQRNYVGPWERGMTRREVLAETDPMLEQAIDLVITEGEASASLIQRKLGLGYPRAARIVDLLHELGVVGEAEPGGRTRKVLIKPGQDPFKAAIDKKMKK
ncbi:MAG: DNA translocase FtsK [Anaerolineae bacterium]|nr:DNA translocase FtsK [Anaerolineae bacterium]